jgi:hypothetical protein
LANATATEARRQIETASMDARKAIPRILLAIALVASVSPAVAKKKQHAGEVSSAQKQAKAKSKINCNAPTPAFIYNPRFMNRGFLKHGKCPK